jgi:hypothetical protein
MNRLRQLLSALLRQMLTSGIDSVDANPDIARLARQASRLEAEKANRMMDELIEWEVRHWAALPDSKQLRPGRELRVIYKVR